MSEVDVGAGGEGGEDGVGVEVRVGAGLVRLEARAPCRRPPACPTPAQVWMALNPR